MPQNSDPTILRDRYELIEVIGSGGFGKTWRAVDTLLEMPVAIKVFVDSNKDNRSRCLREARSLAKFWQEPGIVAVRDYFEEDDAFCLVMEYLEGEDLSSYIKRVGPLSLDATVSLLEPVMTTLEHLHDAGVIHRDVSPDNLRILSDGQMKLLDFGSALSTNSATPGTTVTVKPGYAPPEQYGDAQSQGPWTDVYALAATMWQCLTGRKPMDSLQRTFHDELPTPSALGRPIAPCQESVLMRALALDPNQRVRSVGELRGGLVAEASDKIDAPAPREAPTATPSSSACAPSASASTAAVPASTETAEPARVRARAQATQQTKASPSPKAERAPKEASEKSRPSAKAGAPSPRKAMPVKRPGKPQRAKRAGKPRKALVVAAIALVAAVAAVAAIAVIVLGGGSNPYREYTHTSVIKEDVVSADALAAIARDKETEALTLRQCEVDDEDIKTIGGMDNIKHLRLEECVGYSTLEPLAANKALSDLEIVGYDGFNGDELMPVEYPQITSLTFDTIRFEGSSRFLRHFPALEYLYLTPQEGLGDIEFLESCPNITRIDLSGMDLSGEKSTPLAHCASLVSATLNSCNLDSLAWAKSCPSLDELWASKNSLSSLDGLQNKKCLTKLVLRENQISDLSPLADSQALISVLLGKNEISDLSPLKGNGFMLLLDVAENSIDDKGAQAIGNLGSLTTLGIAGNDLTKLDFCERLIRLKILDASSNKIESLGKLASSSSMVTLLVHHNKLADIDALGNDFDVLAALNVSYNQITSLKPLEKNNALKYLVANDNQIASLDGLQDKPGLEAALFYNNHIADISGLKNSISSLRYLDLGKNQVSDISVLAGFGAGSDKNNVAILLERNNITDASMLPTNKDWREISLYENPLKSISFLANEDLRWNTVYLTHNDGFDYAPLGSCGVFKTLRLVDVPYDMQAKILRDREDTYSWQEPEYLTLEQADEELATLREEINSRVSKLTGETDEDGAEADDESAPESEDAEPEPSSDDDASASDAEQADKSS